AAGAASADADSGIAHADHGAADESPRRDAGAMAKLAATGARNAAVGPAAAESKRCSICQRHAAFSVVKIFRLVRYCNSSDEFHFLLLPEPGQQMSKVFVVMRIRTAQNCKERIAMQPRILLWSEQVFFRNRFS